MVFLAISGHHDWEAKLNVLTAAVSQVKLLEPEVQLFDEKLLGEDFQDPFEFNAMQAKFKTDS